MKTHLLPNLFVWSAVSALLLLAGCSQDHGVTGPVQLQGPEPSAGESPHFLPHQPNLTAAPASALRVSKLISAQKGGDISLGMFKASFPPNSLPADAVITLSQAEQERFVYRMEPADLVLRSPAMLTVGSLNGTTEAAFDNLSFYRISATGMEPLASSDADKGVTGTTGTLGDFSLGGPIGQDGEIQFLHYLSGPGYQTELIAADQGGTVKYDRFTVRLPKGALSEDTYITVRNPGNGYLACELEPHGIQFLQPVELEMDMSGLAFMPYTDWTVYWYDDGDATWENQGGLFSYGKLTVNLHHFSLYQAGRAGW